MSNTARTLPRQNKDLTADEFPSVPLRILLVEDVATDADLSLRELKRFGLTCTAYVVQTVGDYEIGLAVYKPDVILSDVSMPHFDGMQALAIAREYQPDIPFIFVSGTMGEENAIRALRDGATDYVLKTNLIRLGPAVRRAIEEAQERRARRVFERELRANERRYRELFQSNPHPMWVYDTETLRFLAVNSTAVVRYGFSHEEFLAMTIKDICSPRDTSRLLDIVAKPISMVNQPGTWQHRTKKGELIDVEISSHGLVFEGRPARMVVAYDITERKQTEQRLRESEERFRQVAENIREVFWLTDPSKNEMFYISPTYEEIWGRSRQSLYAAPRAWAEAIHLDDRERVLKAAQTRQIAGEYVEEYRIVRPDGTMRWIRDRAFPVTDKDGNVIRIAGIAEDITERKEQEHRIARLSRIQAVLSGINSAIVRIRDRQELFQEACRIAVQHGGFSIGWIAMLDHGGGTLVPVAEVGLSLDLGADGDSSNRPVGLRPWGTAEIALRERRPAFDNDIERGLGEIRNKLGPDTLGLRSAAIRLGVKSVIALPLYVEKKTFAILTLYAPERNFFDDEEIKLLNELAGDISFALAFIAQLEQMQYLAYYDTLTGLPNRSLFFEKLTLQLGTASEEQSNVLVGIVDVDRFRSINDTLGKQGGDALLAFVANRLRSIAPEHSNMARVGGDSFAMAVSGHWEAKDAAHASETYYSACFGEPFVIDGEELRVTATVGLAIFPGDGDQTHSLFTNAGAAMMKAKASNARMLFYRADMNASVAESLRLETKLRRAIENQELVLWYQPKVSVKTRKLSGLEALMRWQDPETGMVLPAKFIPLMEQTGLILDAGRWAMSQVARDCKLWATDGFRPPRVAVNVSPLQIRQTDFIGTVVDAVRETEEAGALLGLEITESAIMENVETIIPILQSLRDLGVEIAVDDFGTGYSSLAYIAQLPIHDLKIDRSFVVGMTESQDNLVIVKAVISLAHSLRLNVTAEGVETEEQAVILRQLECDEMQGYLFSRPVPPARIPELLK